MSSNRLQVIGRHFRKAPERLLVASPTSIHPSTSDLRYTDKNQGIWTEEQRQFYEDNGYLVIRKLLSPEELEKYRQRFQEICERKVVVPRITIMKDISIAKGEFVEGEKAVTKLQSFEHDDVLFQYCRSPVILKHVEAITGPNVMSMHTMLINKPPDTGKKTSRHPLHQDMHYFVFRPADRIVASWTAMQKVDRSNGCLVVLPGSHKGPLKIHKYPEWEGGVNKMYHGIQDFDPNAPRVHLPMDVGDTVFFHPLLIHGSGTNMSNGFRKAISCHFASSECHYIDVEGTEHEKIAKESVEVAKSTIKKRTGKDVDITIADVWKLKGRVVQGSRISL